MKGSGVLRAGHAGLLKKWACVCRWVFFVSDGLWQSGQFESFSFVNVARSAECRDANIERRRVAVDIISLMGRGWGWGGGRSITKRYHVKGTNIFLCGLAHKPQHRHPPPFHPITHTALRDLTIEDPLQDPDTSET